MWRFVYEASGAAMLGLAVYWLLGWPEGQSGAAYAIWTPLVLASLLVHLEASRRLRWVPLVAILLLGWIPARRRPVELDDGAN